jgi:polysaccharide deacetylase family protein (PEP-CTERM system associated)
MALTRAAGALEDRIVPMPSPPIAFSVDVEDYYQVQLFESAVPRREWDRWESRVARNTDRLLEILAAAGARATFFVLGCIAERDPAVVRAIAGAGHEVASHGWAHHPVTTQTPDEFTADVRRSVGALTAAASVAIEGYRAASFSIVRDSLWALDRLAELGFRYDSSVFPIHHDRYGIPDYPRTPAVVRSDPQQGDFVEFPMSTVRWMGMNMPLTGGGYLRLLPYAAARWALRRIASEGLPAMVYIHPWEIDPGQPRVPVGPLVRARHYANLDRTESKLRRLLDDFEVTTVSDAIRRSVRPNWR